MLIVIGLSFLTFLLLFITPGDPAVKKLNAQGVMATDEEVARTREEMGLNKPFLIQYFDWAGSALKGDLGESYIDGAAVTQEMTRALGYTSVLAFTSLFLALIVALPLSILTAVKNNTIFDHIIRFLSFVGNSVPNFLISVLLIYALCIKIRLFSVVSTKDVKGMFLPCIALAIPMCGRFIRQFKAEILEQLGKEYVQGAKARGVKQYYILFKNVLHNASISIITIVAMAIGGLMGGSVVIETIFGWPGMGKMVMDAITNRDYPVVQGFVLFIAIVYVLVNLVADLIYHAIDPRVREV